MRVNEQLNNAIFEYKKCASVSFLFHLGDEMKIVKMNVEWRLALDYCAPLRGGVTMRIANVRAFRLRQLSRPTRVLTDVQPNQRPTHFYPLVLLLLYCIKLAEIWHTVYLSL